MSDYQCVMPFFIDTDGYSDRDRLMFVCGVEFEMLYQKIRGGARGKFDVPIHTENESRVRMMCGKLGLVAVIEPSGTDGWSYLEVNERNGQ